MFDIFTEFTPRSTPVELPFPGLGEKFVLNEFYRKFETAATISDEHFLFMWSLEDIDSVKAIGDPMLGDRYTFFSSDGLGNRFGFHENQGDIMFVSAPDIGSLDDVKELGDWVEFIQAIRDNKYV